MLRKAFLVCLFASLFACHTNKKKQLTFSKSNSDKQPVELEVTSFKKNRIGNKDTVICELALINNTFWDISYVAMYCSYNEAFCTDFPRLRPVVEDCNKNSPALYILGFYEKEIKQVAFCFDSAAHIPTNTPIQLGFHFVRSKYIPAIDPRVLLKDTANIIWSKPIEL